jgi:uncharacterized CHY-type Zn-finger protein
LKNKKTSNNDDEEDEEPSRLAKYFACFEGKKKHSLRKKAKKTVAHAISSIHFTAAAIYESSREFYTLADPTMQSRRLAPDTLLSIMREFIDRKKIQHRQLPPPFQQLAKNNGQHQQNQHQQQQQNEQQYQDNSVLLTACLDHQTSADYMSAEKSIRHGVFTNFLLVVLKENNYNISYHKLIYCIREKMNENKFTQKPSLEAEPRACSLSFLRPFD